MHDSPAVFSAMIGVAMIVGFSFQDTELIGIAAGESENPGENIPRAVPGLLAYPAVLRLRDPDYQPDHSVYRSSLLRNDVKDISVSPFTLVFSMLVCCRRRQS